MGKTHLYYEFSPCEVVDSNLFWLTEYIKRNPRRQEWFVIQGAEIEKEYGMQTGEANFDMSVFYDEEGLPTFSPNRKSDVEAIIKMMSAGNFVPKCDPFYFDSDLLSPVQMVIEEGKLPRFEFDIDGDSAIISTQVRSLLDYYRGIRRPVATGFLKLTTLDDVEYIQQEDRYMIRSLPSIKADLQLELKARQAGDTARAIGLWLWDYVQEHGGREKRGVISEAIRSAREMLRILGGDVGYYSGSADKVLNNFFTKTEACITACDVLPFK